jgi:hypothetical protein
VTWYATASGGNGNYTYSWSGDVGGSGSSVSSSYGSYGSKVAYVRITSNNESITVNCSTNVQNNNNYYNNNLSLSCYANPTNANINQSVTWYAVANGGNGSYYYSWTGDAYGNGQNVSNSYNTSGTKYATVTVNSNGQIATASCNTFVNGGNIVYTGGNYPNNGNLASGVFLSQIPYTGISQSMKMTLFVVGMTLWSAFMAWIIMKKKAKKQGITVSQMIEKFKQENLAKKQIVG